MSLHRNEVRHGQGDLVIPLPVVSMPTSRTDGRKSCEGDDLATLAVALMVFVLPQSASAVRRGAGRGLAVSPLRKLWNVQAGITDGILDEAALSGSTRLTGTRELLLPDFPTNANPASLLQYFYKRSVTKPD